MGLPPAQRVNEFHALPIKRDIMVKWLSRNAAARLGIDPASVKALG